jgi:hypothetical protein
MNPTSYSTMNAHLEYTTHETHTISSGAPPTTLSHFHTTYTTNYLYYNESSILPPVSTKRHTPKSHPKQSTPPHYEDRMTNLNASRLPVAPYIDTTLTPSSPHDTISCHITTLPSSTPVSIRLPTSYNLTNQTKNAHLPNKLELNLGHLLIKNETHNPIYASLFPLILPCVPSLLNLKETQTPHYNT